MVGNWIQLCGKWMTLTGIQWGTSAYKQASSLLPWLCTDKFKKFPLYKHYRFLNQRHKGLLVCQAG